MSTVQLETIAHRIGGAVAGGSSRTTPVYDPATGRSSDRCCSAARRRRRGRPGGQGGVREVARQSVTRRARVMFEFRELVDQHTDELARIISSEHGKTFDDARGEVMRGMEVVEFACGSPSDQGRVLRAGLDRGRPALVPPAAGRVRRDHPVQLPDHGPDVDAPDRDRDGNTFVLKPSERDPSVSNLVAELYARAGLPDGVFNVVHGDKVAVDALLDHPDVAAISFVGSTPIAKYVHERASGHGKRVQALGGPRTTRS